MKFAKRMQVFSAGEGTANYSEDQKHKIKPHKLPNLRDCDCVLVHCECGFRRVTLPPLDANGSVPKWFPSWRKLF